MGRFIKELGEKLSFFLQNSIAGKAERAFVRGCKRLMGKSFVWGLLSRESLEQGVANSAVYSGITGLFEGLRGFSYRFGQKMIAKSLFIEHIQRAIAYVEYGGNLCSYYFQYSLSAQVLYGKGREERKAHEKPEKAAFPFAGVGILLGLLLLFVILLGPVKGGIFFCGLLFLGALMSRPRLGIYCVAGFAPFLPTMALAGLLLVTGGCFLLQLMLGKKYHFRLDKIGLFLLIFSLLLLFYGITSYSVRKSLQIALLEILFIGAYFLITSLIVNKQEIKNILFIYCTSALLTGIVGLYQFLSGKVDVTWTDTELFEEIGLRVYSTFENPNVYGEYLLLAIPVAIAMIFLCRGLGGRLYYAGISAVLLVNLGLTYSRGCYLALGVGGVVMIFCLAPRLLVLAVPGVAVLPFVLPASVIARLFSITNFADTSTAYRLNIWQGAVRLLGDFWHLGIGLGEEAFHMIYPKYSLNAIAAPHSHNLYLQIMLEMGIAGFFTFFMAMVCFANTCIIAMRNARFKSKMIVSAIFAGTLAFLFQGVFDYVWYNYRVFLLFFITMGIGVSCCRFAKRGEELD